MGTAQVQGSLWAARAQDWAALQEGTSRPLSEAVFAIRGIGPGTPLLDAGCGTGLAAQLATDMVDVTVGSNTVQDARDHVGGRGGS